MSTSASLVSRADVVTDVRGRYPNQLVGNLGRTVEVLRNGDTRTAHVAGSAAGIAVGVLVPEAEAPAGLSRLETALGNHPEVMVAVGAAGNDEAVRSCREAAWNGRVVTSSSRSGAPVRSSTADAGRTSAHP
jgi:hypothetical protein